MKQTLTYRLVTIGLIAVFAISTIGLPIVIASCPMMKSAATRSACCSMSSSKEGSESIAKTRSKDCCKMVMAGERNTNEFVQSQYQAQFTLASVAVIPPAMLAPNSGCPTLLTPDVFLSAARAEDIPIINSTLRI